jgi:non-homologous end joining protein Ku
VKPYRAWRGALELEFQTDAGRIPMSISCELYSRVKKTRSESFTTIAPSGQKAETKRIDPATGEEFSGSRKAVKVGKEFVPMTEEALEQINAGTRTKLLKPEAFCPASSIAFDLAIDRFYVRPQKDVAGLFAALLPFEEEVYPAPSFVFEENEHAGNLFAAMVEQEHEIEDFDHSAWESEYRARRQAAIDAVVAGAPVAVEPEPETKEVVPDLMAALMASVSKNKPAAKKPAKKKEKVTA